MKCPYCDLLMECDTVDVGVGFMQCGPYYCDNCQASQIGPELSVDLKQELENGSIDQDEYRTGFYKGGRHSPYANTVGGKLVSHEVARSAYKLGILDKPEREI